MPTRTRSTRNSPTIEDLRDRIERLLETDGPRYRRLWPYYRNPMLPSDHRAESQGAERPYRQAQEWGLPPRITGVVARPIGEVTDGEPVEGVARKEVVVENDIAWRVETMVDYLFGRPVVINSTVEDPARRARVERLARAVIEHNGGIVFLQQLALIGAVYGFVDVLVKFDASQYNHNEDDDDDDEPSPDGSGPSTGPGEAGSLPPQAVSAPVAPGAHTGASSSPAGAGQPAAPPPPPVDESSSHPGASVRSRDDALARIARTVRLEIVEPARALPLLSANDWRVVDGYVQVYRVSRGSVEKPASLRDVAKWGL